MKYRIRNEKFRSNAMVTRYGIQKHPSWHGLVMRMDDNNGAKEITTMKVGGKRHRARPRLRCMDTGRSDMK